MKKHFAFLLFAFPLLVQAQTDSLLSYWNITFHTGLFVSGVPGYLEERMRSNGFGQSSSGFFGLGAEKYPISREVPALQFGIERITRKPWSGKFLLSYMKGHVYGYSNIHGDFEITYNSNTASFLIGIHSKRRITRLAIGPALHFVSVKTTAYSLFKPTVNEQISNAKAGFVMETGVRFPARKSRMFLDLLMQYQFMGKQYFGFYNFTNTDAIGQPQSISFSVGSKSFSYLSFSFGLGIRLGKPLK